MADNFVERELAQLADRDTISRDAEAIGCFEHRYGGHVFFPLRAFEARRDQDPTVDGDEWIRTNLIVDVTEVR